MPRELPASRSNVPDLVESSLRSAMSIVDALTADSRTVAAPEPADAGDVELDLVDHLLGAAWFNQYQLGLLVSLVGHVQPTQHTVAAIIDGAKRLAPASSAAIGAAATLLSLVRDGDEYAVAECLGRAQACFDDEELLAGSAALTASLCLTIADTLALDASLTFREMVDAVTGAEDRQVSASVVPVATIPAPLRRVRRAERRRGDRTRCAPARLGVTLRLS